LLHLLELCPVLVRQVFLVYLQTHHLGQQFLLDRKDVLEVADCQLVEVFLVLPVLFELHLEFCKDTP
jgi:hypothetical protein